MMRAPGGHIDLLELLYWCLSLGYQGKFALEANGAAGLERVREALYQTIARVRPPVEVSLSDALMPVGGAARRPSGLAPAWVIAACVGVVLFAALVILRVDLGNRTSLVRAKIETLQVGPGQVAAALPALAAPQPRLRGLLVEEQGKGWVEVEDRLDHSVIRLTRAAAFASGSAELSSIARPIIEAIGAELRRHPGAILVTGHADSTPIGSKARYPSNWHLSEARALTVQRALRDRIGPDRPIRVEGRADSEPAGRGAPGDDAWNRRVEITLFVRP